MAERGQASSEPADGRRFLAFRLDDRLYALPAQDVVEIMRVSSLARVPQAPASLLGLANLRGRVLPVASLRMLLRMEEAPDAASGLALILSGAAPVAIKVDGAPVLVGAANVQTNEEGGVARAGERLLGAFEDEQGEVARILDIRALLAGAFAARAPERETRPRSVKKSAEALRNENDDQQKIISFVVAGQEFALELEAVREIIMAPTVIAAVPNSEDAVVGVTAYRTMILPLLSLRRLLGLGEANAGERSKVVVSTVGGALIGLVADQAKAIVTVGQDQSDPPPTVLAARTGAESQIKAIYRGEGGQRLITILSPEQLFRGDIMDRLNAAGARAPSSDLESAAEEERDTFLVFRLGDDEFALPISSVIEVARIPAHITKVPKTPAFLEGVVSFRGEVLPVVDQRRRFDMPVREGDETRRLIVVKSDRHRAGVIVDAVSEVLSSARDAIDPAPDLAGEQTRLVQGVINLEADGRMLMVLDPAELLSRAERSLLDAFAPEIPDA